MNFLMYRNRTLLGLLLLLGQAGQAQDLSDKAVLDSASVLLATHHYQEVVDLLRDNVMPRSGETEQLLGVAYLQLGQYDLAIRQGELAAEKGVQLGFLLKGDAFVMREELDSAVVAYSHCVEELPDNTDGWLKRAMAYAGQQQWGLSDRDFQAVLQRDSTQVEAWLGLARNAYATARYEEGVAALDKMEQLTTEHAELYTLRAWCALNLGRLDASLDDAVRALHLGDSDGVALVFAIGNLDAELAMGRIKAAALLYPTEFVWPYCLGVLHMSSLHYQDAIPCLQEAYRLFPMGATSEQVAKCYEVLGLYAEAVTAIDEAIRLEPNTNRYYKLRMQLLAYSGRVDEAIQQGQRFLNVQPDDVETYNFLGYLCYWQRNWESAAGFVSMGIELDRSFAPMYVLRGMILLAKGDEAGAERDFQTALQRYDDGKTIASKYHAYAGLGRVDEGIAALEQYLGYESDDASAYYDGACFYARLGQNEKAVAYLEEAARRGFCQCALLLHDPDMAGLRGDERFEELLRQLAVTYHYGEQLDKR